MNKKIIKYKPSSGYLKQLCLNKGVNFKGLTYSQMLNKCDLVVNKPDNKPKKVINPIALKTLVNAQKKSKDEELSSVKRVKKVRKESSEQNNLTKRKQLKTSFVAKLKKQGRDGSAAKLIADIIYDKTKTASNLKAAYSEYLSKKKITSVPSLELREKTIQDLKEKTSNAQVAKNLEKELYEISIRSVNPIQKYKSKLRSVLKRKSKENMKKDLQNKIQIKPIEKQKIEKNLKMLYKFLKLNNV